LQPIAIVEFDDFYLPSSERARRAAGGDDEIAADFDWRRLRDQVLKPLSQDQPARYQRNDWQGDELAEWHELRAGGIVVVVVVEGNYSTRPELRAFYDVTLWVEASTKETLSTNYSGLPNLIGTPRERGLRRTSLDSLGFRMSLRPIEDGHRPAWRRQLTVAARPEARS
jgi:hypothetical protein